MQKEWLDQLFNWPNQSRLDRPIIQLEYPTQISHSHTYQEAGRDTKGAADTDCATVIESHRITPGDSFMQYPSKRTKHSIALSAISLAVLTLTQQAAA